MISFQRRNFDSRTRGPRSGKTPARGMRRRPRIEPLESKALLDSGGISAFLSLSFVPDGTQVSSQSSELFAALNPLGPAETWQRTIEQAFNLWAVHTNADVARVADDGSPLGIPGQRFADDRFGDVRVAAVPLSDSVLAISFPWDNVALGTWSSDIVFNSNHPWGSLDEIASVALHEAGHIFGLEHSHDPLSAMHVHGISNVSRPSAQDVAELQQLFGNRDIDPHEDALDNDEIGQATVLTEDLGSEQLSLSYGDLSTAGDVDIFRIASDEEIEGTIFVSVETMGLSLMEPVVQLLGPDHEVLREVTATNGIAGLEYITEDDFEELFVSVTAADESPSPIGRYSVAVTLVEEDFDDDDYEDFLQGDLFGLDADLLRSLVLDEDDEIDLDEFDAPGLGEAKRLLPVSLNAGQIWFEQLGSIVDGNDTDVYILDDLDDAEERPGNMTIRIQSMTLGGLIPKVAIHDSEGRLLPREVISHGNGELVVQVTRPEEEDNVSITVSAEDPAGAFVKGDYRLSVTVGTSLVELAEFSSGELSSTEPVSAQLFHVATPQLFHFLVSTESSSGDAATAVSMDIFDDRGQLVYSLVSGANAIRSGANPLLHPGTYTLRVGAVGGTIQDAIRFQVNGIATSNPLGVVPVDPSQQPVFQCEDLTHQFCYPGQGPTESPFFWSHFIDQYQDQLPSDGAGAAVTDPSTHWWDWYLAESPPTRIGLPPVTQHDEFRIRGGMLRTSASGGVLTNDDPASPLAVVAIPPRHGVLELNGDGSFHYVVDPSFFGTDTFWYQAVEQGSPSPPTRVELLISQPGDVNDDGQVDFADFVLLAAHFGQAGDWRAGDFDGDGRIAFQDFIIMASNYSLA